MHSPSIIQNVDAIFNVTGLLVRTVLYGVLGELLSHHQTGAMLLMGLFAGDALASAIHIFWDEAGHTTATIAELLLLATLFFWVGREMPWQQALTSSSPHFWMTAAGVIALRLKRGLLKPVGPNDYGWS